MKKNIVYVCICMLSCAMYGQERTSKHNKHKPDLRGFPYTMGHHVTKRDTLQLMGEIAQEQHTLTPLKVMIESGDVSLDLLRKEHALCKQRYTVLASSMSKEQKKECSEMIALYETAIQKQSQKKK